MSAFGKPLVCKFLIYSAKACIWLSVCVQLSGCLFLGSSGSSSSPSSVSEVPVSDPAVDEPIGEDDSKINVPGTPAAGPIITKLVSDIRAATQDQFQQALLVGAWLTRSVSPPVGTGQDTIPILPGESDEDYIERVFTILLGECGTMDFAFEVLARQLQLPHRRAVMPYVPGQGGHVATEVYVNEKWFFFDASFGVYFTEKGAPSKFLSLAEARRLYPMIDVRQLGGPLWTKTHADINGLAQELRGGSLYQISLERFVKNPFDVTGKVVLAEIRTTYFSGKAYSDTQEVSADDLTIDLNKMPAGRLGEKNRSYADLLRLQDTGNGAVYVAELPYLGNHSALNGFILKRRFNFVVSEPQQISFTIDFVNLPTKVERESLLERVESTNGSFSLSEAYVLTEWKDYSVTFRMNVHPPLSIFRLRISDSQRDSVRMYFDSISWEQKAKAYLLPDGLVDLDGEQDGLSALGLSLLPASFKLSPFRRTQTSYISYDQ